jgi:acyl-CoA synthetase (AMP-forming)/AMP-acid ligase II
LTKSPPQQLHAETFAGLIAARAAATPDAPMLFDEHDRVLSFAAYAAAVEDTARTCAALGMRPGDGVAWQLPTRIETLVLMGALARLGVTQVPVLPIHRERELRFILDQTRARWLCQPGSWRGFDYAALAERVRPDAAAFRSVVCDPKPVAPARNVETTVVPEAPSDGEAVRWIYYSSGTTADPKGVRHVDRAAMAAGRAFATAQGFRPDDRYGLAFPFTHIGGLLNLAAILGHGFALILLEAFEPERAARVLARHGATVAGGGPAFIRAYLEQQRKQPGHSILPALRFMASGGAAMPPAMHDEVRDEIGGRGTAQGYGMTETCAIITMNHPEDSDEHLRGTVGRVVPGMELRVAGPDGAELAPGAEGEIRVRGELLFAGYLDAALDADAFDADGWFRTGDLGTVDAEGYVRLTGRLKDIIIRKGENISARELEDLLYEHPDVADVAVIGLPDDERGELVCAVIVPRPGAVPPTLERVAAHLAARGLMRQKLPERVETLGELPRNPSGKILKPDLVRRYAPTASRRP